GRDSLGDRVAHRRAVHAHVRTVDLEAPLLQCCDDQRPGGVFVDTRRRTVGGHHDGGTLHAHRLHSPDLPPDFASMRTSLITAPLSTAFTMSITVRAATETAVR